MSRWFINHRQEFIAATLRTFGQINRGLLVERFGISMPQASADIAMFIRERPDVLVYDGKAKAYVLNADALSETQEGE